MLLEVAFASTPRERRIVVIYVRNFTRMCIMYSNAHECRNTSMPVLALWDSFSLDFLFLITIRLIAMKKDFLEYQNLYCGFSRY